MKLQKLYIPLAIALTAFQFQISASDVRMTGADVGEWTMDFDAASELAEKEDLPMLLNFTGSDWCIWCKKMEAQVFSKDAWKSFASDKVVLVTLDFPRNKTVVPPDYQKRNDKLQKKFEIKGFPTYIILESDGKTELGQLGAGDDKTAESFIEEFEGVMKMSDSYVEALEKRDPAKAEALKAAIKELKDARKDLDNWIATRPQKTPENAKLYEDFANRIKLAKEAMSGL